MEFRNIKVKGIEYVALKLPDAKAVKEQHQQFLKIFEKSTPEVQKLWAKSKLFGDPTENVAQDILDDTSDNMTLIPDHIMKTLDADPEAEISEETVYLVKPSGVYALTYVEAMGMLFPRIVPASLKTDMNPADFINQNGS